MQTSNKMSQTNTDHCFSFSQGVDRTAGAIRGRSGRVIDVVTAEMEKYEPGEYTEGVLESVRVLRDQSEYFSDLISLENELRSFSYSKFCRKNQDCY